MKRVNNADRGSRTISKSNLPRLASKTSEATQSVHPRSLFLFCILAPGGSKARLSAIRLSFIAMEPKPRYSEAEKCESSKELPVSGIQSVPGTSHSL